MVTQAYSTIIFKDLYQILCTVFGIDFKTIIHALCRHIVCLVYLFTYLEKVNTVVNVRDQQYRYLLIYKVYFKSIYINRY